MAIKIWVYAAKTHHFRMRQVSLARKPGEPAVTIYGQTLQLDDNMPDTPSNMRSGKSC